MKTSGNYPKLEQSITALKPLGSEVLKHGIFFQRKSEIYIYIYIATLDLNSFLVLAVSASCKKACGFEQKKNQKSLETHQK